MRIPATMLAIAFLVAGCADDGADVSSGTAVDTPAATSTTAADAAPVDAADPNDAPLPVDADIDTDVVTDLSSDEIAGLLWMREEEQLAHDVYTTLGSLWDVPIFSNIAASERRHIESTISLLDRYGIDDPAAGNAPGTFADPLIQQLHDDLVAEGSTSRAAALTVGATIEELDIGDLRARADASDEAAIVEVYRRLERGSRNHLRAFVRQLDRLGESYEPTVLDDFDEIVDGPTERGRDA